MKRGAMPEFSGRVEVVSGTASGIGKAAALPFAESCARVVVADIDDAHPLPEMPEKHLDRAVAVTLEGVSLCMKYEFPASPSRSAAPS